jgi:DNA-binding MarR family transcriptional regulator
MRNETGYDSIIQILRTANVLWKESRRFFAPFGITEAQFNVLNLLGQEPEGYSQRELSDLLVVDRSNITLLLDRMLKQSWVTKKDVPGDRRAYNVVLTPSGRKLWEQIFPHYKRAIEKLITPLSQQEVKVLNKTLKAIELNVDSWRQ